MPKTIEKIKQVTLPAIVMRGLLVYPEINLSFEVNRDISFKAVEYAEENKTNILLLAQKNMEIEKPEANDIYRVGTIAKIRQVINITETTKRIIIEGVSRAEVTKIEFADGFFMCGVLNKSVHLTDNGGIRGEALIAEAIKLFEKYSRHLPKISRELVYTMHTVKNPGVLADFIASNIYLPLEKKQALLEEFDLMKRLERLCVFLEKEIELLEIGDDIRRKVKTQVDKNQRDYFLREQLKVLQNELGESANDSDTEIEEYQNKLKNLQASAEIYEKLDKEISKLARTAFGSPESTVIRNYLDLCFELPWEKRTRDRIDLAEAEKILERDHDGLEKVKERILEFLAVKARQPGLGGQILCLVGPPGVGKTSIAASVARSLKRKYVRVSLGGVRDEADIRGHRRTYIGAMPGRIVNALKEAKSINPLIVFDEIDKLTRDSHGDPSSALLEVLDSEQNKAFRDHFLELPLNLSECFFIATANTLDTIPKPLVDRMEIIQISSYTRNEKFAIAKNHLIEKQTKKHGLNKKTLKFKDDAILELIDYYTREAGVRNLEREIANVCRKIVRKLQKDGLKSVTVDTEAIRTLLGNRKYKDDSVSRENEVGVVNGLAWTAMGGEILQAEAAVLDGSGKIEMTGSLGDVMKESVKAAISYIRSIADKYGIDKEFHKTKDIHVHFPEGAVPKDGPSAGITIASAIFSQLTGYPVRHDAAMTGEITIRGRVLPIGGLKEKTIAAYKTKMKTVIIPEANLPDLDDIDKTVRESLCFIPVKSAEQVFVNALIFPEDGEPAHRKQQLDGGQCQTPKPTGIGDLKDGEIPFITPETNRIPNLIHIKL